MRATQHTRALTCHHSKAQCVSADGLVCSDPEQTAPGKYAKCPKVDAQTGAASCDGSAVAVLDANGNVVGCSKIKECEDGTEGAVGTDGKFHCIEHPDCADGEQSFVKGATAICAVNCAAGTKRMVLDNGSSKCVKECPSGTTEIVSRKRDNKGKGKGSACLPPLAGSTVAFGSPADLNNDGVPDCCRGDRANREADANDRKRDDGGRRRLPCPPTDANGAPVVCPAKVNPCPEGQRPQTDSTAAAGYVCVAKEDDGDRASHCCDDRKRDGGSRTDCVNVVCGCKHDQVSVNGQCVDKEDCTLCQGQIDCGTDFVCPVEDD